MTRNAQTAAMFEQGVKEFFVVEKKVAGVGVGEEFDQAIGVAGFFAQHGENKINIFGSELYAAREADGSPGVPAGTPASQ